MRPGVYAARDVGHLVKTVLHQEGGHPQAAHAVVAQASGGAAGVEAEETAEEAAVEEVSGEVEGDCAEKEGQTGQGLSPSGDHCGQRLLLPKGGCQFRVFGQFILGQSSGLMQVSSVEQSRSFPSPARVSGA